MVSSPQEKLMEQLVQLTEAVKQLAERPTPPSREFDAATDADRIRQRVTFGYQALGTLTGRVSTSTGREFDVQVVAARRRRGVVAFRRLPQSADFVELRNGGKVEVLRIRRGEDYYDRESDENDRDENNRDEGGGVDTPPARTTEGHRRPDHGLVRPRLFADNEQISSLVFLRTRLGPLIAFGPRLAPLTSGTRPTDPTATEKGT